MEKKQLGLWQHRALTARGAGACAAPPAGLDLAPPRRARARTRRRMGCHAAERSQETGPASGCYATRATGRRSSSLRPRKYRVTYIRCCVLRTRLRCWGGLHQPRRRRRRRLPRSRGGCRRTLFRYRGLRARAPAALCPIETGAIQLP